MINKISFFSPEAEN